MARAKVTIKPSGFNALFNQPTSPVVRHMNRVGAAVSAVAKIYAPVGESGNLRRSIDYELIAAPPRLTARVFATVDYAKVVHEGRPEVRPKHKKALRWKKKGKTVFATRSKAVAGKPYLADAVKQVTGKTPRAGTA